MTGAEIKLVCLDIDGTLTDGIVGPALPGAVEVVTRLASSRRARFVTNATSVSPDAIVRHLRGLGFPAEPHQLYTPLFAARRLLTEREHNRGILLADPRNLDAFDWYHQDREGPSVLLATDGHHLRVSDLGPAVGLLLRGATLYTLQRNRYFRRGAELVTDLGPIAAFLEYAASTQAENLGKPSLALFDAIAKEERIRREEILMVGDDLEFDASASVRLGMRGIGVRTGKYRPSDEARVSPAPTAVLDSIVDLEAWLERS